MVLFVILRCNSNCFYLSINPYFLTFNWHLKVSLMQKDIQDKKVLTQSMLFPDSGLVFFFICMNIFILFLKLKRHTMDDFEENSLVDQEIIKTSETLFAHSCISERIFFKTGGRLPPHLLLSGYSRKESIFVCFF